MKALIGFLVASVIVAFFAPMAIEMKIMIYPMAFFIGSFIVVLFLVPVTALPIYLVITNKFGFSITTTIISAVLSTTFVSFFFILPTGLDSSIVNGTVMVENGTTTIDGYIKVLQQLSMMGLVGLLSGISFYYIKKVGIKN